MRQYMLDSDTCSYIIKERPASVLRRFRKLAMEQICVSAITYAELLYGVERSSSTRINQPILDDFLRHLDVLSWNHEAAEQYGKLSADLEVRGTPLGAMDMMIAAHARSLKAVLVTNNKKHFSKVKALKIENWFR